MDIDKLCTYNTVTTIKSNKDTFESSTDKTEWTFQKCSRNPEQKNGEKKENQEVKKPSKTK